MSRNGPGNRDRLRLPLLACFALGVGAGWAFWGSTGGWILAVSLGLIPVAALPQVFRGDIRGHLYHRVIEKAFRLFYVAPGFHDLQLVEESVSTAAVVTLLAWSAGLGFGGVLAGGWPSLPWCAG